MKYELIKTDISSERTIMQDIIETYQEANPEGEMEEKTRVIGQEPTDNYEVTITLGIHSIDNIAPDFSKDIIVTHYNSQTGFEVDEQREQAIQDYLNLINQ